MLNIWQIFGIKCRWLSVQRTRIRFNFSRNAYMLMSQRVLRNLNQAEFSFRMIFTCHVIAEDIKNQRRARAVYPIRAKFRFVTHPFVASIRLYTSIKFRSVFYLVIALDLQLLLIMAFCFINIVYQIIKVVNKSLNY